MKREFVEDETLKLFALNIVLIQNLETIKFLLNNDTTASVMISNCISGLNQAFEGNYSTDVIELSKKLKET